jgi:lantibiotic transport system permease protein
MKPLARVLHAEALKMKRTLALKMVVLAPATVVVLVLLMAVNAPFSTINRSGNGKEWLSLARLALLFWAALMMPLYIALEAALLAGLDHADNQWKSLLSRPVPRWTWYAAKLIVLIAMLAASTAILLCGVLVTGLILPRIQPELAFSFPVPWQGILKQGVQIAGLAFLALTIQHWVSLRWRSFSVAIGVGMVAMVFGYVAAMSTNRTADLPQYFPWALPMLVLSRHPQDATAALWLSIPIGILVATAGCWDFLRRDVS